MVSFNVQDAFKHASFGAQYIPIVSSLSGPVDLFLKIALPLCLKESTIKDNAYLNYVVNDKSTLRCLIAAFPFVGNMTVAIYEQMEQEPIHETLQSLSFAAQYIPIVSTLAGVTEIFIKCTDLRNLSKADIKSNSYYEYINDKSFLRILIASIPIAGNISLVIYDLNKKDDEPRDTFLKWCDEKTADRLTKLSLFHQNDLVDLLSDIKKTREYKKNPEIFKQKIRETLDYFVNIENQEAYKAINDAESAYPNNPIELLNALYRNLTLIRPIANP